MSETKTTISRLSIGGFKSFADDVRLDILPGLTGIVGPNGCGKSNVVEALRWAMGETSARALRGGELDDLIFAGTGARPARNLAQVTLHLTNAAGLAPAPFQDSDELEVSRRAERGSGSDYRINGKSTRARDVQTLFADLASGARSSAIISQNRVGQLINAKPEERRLLLEEAAGITGLHARRHDAELKLRQTEANLARAEDLRLQLEERLTGLEAQSAQARTYREVSARLREAETLLHALLHARAAAAVDQSLSDLTKARHTLREAEQAAEAAVVAEFEARKSAPLAREETDRLRIALERLTLQTETTRADLERAKSTRLEAEERLAQAQADLARALTAREQLATQRSETQTSLDIAIAENTALPSRLGDIRKAISGLDTALSAATEALEQITRERDAEAIRRDSLVKTVQDLEARLSQDIATRDALEAELAQLRLECPSDTMLLEARSTAADAAQALEIGRTNRDEAQKRLQRAGLDRELAHRTLKDGRDQAMRLATTEAEINARLKRIEELDLAGQAAREQAQDAILTESRREAFEMALQHLNTEIAQAATAEEQGRALQDDASERWVQARARAEESAQLRQARLRECETAQAALDKARETLAQARASFDSTQRNLIPDVRVQEATDSVAHLESELTNLQSQIDHTEQQLQAAITAESTEYRRATDLETELTRLESECESLRVALAACATQPEALEAQLDIPVPLARAVASALSDGLDASLAGEHVTSDRRWTLLPPLSAEAAFPGCCPLSHFLQAPDALQRCLNAIFLLEDEAEGAALQPSLQPGQSLVGRSGALWRWDGFIRSANAPDPLALRIEQRARLLAAEQEQAERLARQPAIQQAADDAKQARIALENALRLARTTRGDLEPRLADARAKAAEIERRARLADAEHIQATRLITQAQSEAETAEQRLNDAQTALDQLPEIAHLQAEAEFAAQTAQRARDDLTQHVAHHRALRDRREAEARARDQASIRHDSAVQRLTELEDTQRQLATERHDLITQQNALSETGRAVDVDALERHASDADRDVASAEAAMAQAENALATALEHSRQTAQTLTVMENTAAGATVRIETLTPRLSAQTATVLQLEAALQEARARLNARPAPAMLDQTVAEASDTLTVYRQQMEQARQDEAALTLADVRLTSERNALTERLSAIEAQSGDTALLHAELEQRVSGLQAVLSAAMERPEVLSARLAQVERERIAAQLAHDAARARDEAASKADAQAQDQRREAEQALSAAREAIARLTERAEQAKAARDRLLSESEPPRGGEKPDDLSDQAESSLRRRISRMIRERDDLGPVNLRANIEYAEARETSETISREHAELTAAIARLRGGIGTINKEGRERLGAVFIEVDRHFQSLFARMFGGGRAHLGLVGSDDPLEAGLEIFAQPPGKKLATLSLLSGGEQALTALSLIFATFRCNLAPICVLDEVDAPLDDANVERFCALLSDITKEAGTRFLVVTHHQLTMAHMDRLFGVTMQERGVSRILSVDLGRATQMSGG